MEEFWPKLEKAPAGTGAGSKVEKRKYYNTDSSRQPPGPPEDSKKHLDVMATIAPPTDADGHGRFRDICLVYGDFYRDVFLEQIKEWFISSASNEELAAIRRSVTARAQTLRHQSGKRGRPRGEDSEEFLYQARLVAWRRIICKWKWERVTEAAGLVPSKPNIRTIQRRLDYLAGMIWRALPQTQHADHPEKLERDLEAASLQRWIRSKTGLPFDTHPEECKKIVLKLAPRGLSATAEIISRLRKK